ncbi:hypothetical protein KR084_000714 [Drosophila pseudotakahashii]|nr:hypothetical protein KR084_000714 [Drosophila pseudotakahashii]
MNCGALRAISDDLQMQTVNSTTTPQQRKMHSMPRTAPQSSAATQNSAQNSTPNASAHHPSRSGDQQPQSAALRRSTMPRGRGLASCLRGERDDAPTPPIHEVHCDVQQLQLLQQQQQQQHQPQQQHQLLLQQEQLQQERMSGSGSGASTMETTGRSEYKSKTLPRIHFDTALNDTSLNEVGYSCTIRISMS